MSDTAHYSRHVDLHYSPDDNGWYAQDYTDGATTEIYDAKGDLIRALVGHTAEWDR